MDLEPRVYSTILATSTCSPTRPVEEVTSLLSHLGIQLSLQEVEGEEGGWSTRENTVSVYT